ncbi:uncharacterized protein [Argopecten irradians]|uniref:uncharacterized protein n=1 Tax=Argopecten irradians TaxID=31199 RepID=UPI00371B0239
MWFSNTYGMPTDQRVPVEDFTDGNIVKLSVASVIFVIVIVITVICHSRISDSSCQWIKRLLCCTCCACIDSDRRLKLVSHDMGSDCAICLEPKDSKTKPVVMVTCNHSYHQACISRWLEMDNLSKCPQCRRQPEQYSTTERFIAVIKTLLMKRKERTLVAKATECQQAAEKEEEEEEDEEEMVPGHAGKCVI